MDIKLLWMKIKNFKGIREFELVLNGKDAHVYGDNATGKTSLADLFYWVFFDKSSDNRSTFKIKPQDKDGNEIHMLQTSGEINLSVDGKPMLFKKMSEEKWTKKHGAEEKILTGNTLSYWIDEVPVKESEYKNRIKEIFDEKVFRMITNPMYFNTSLKWEERRKIILEICGDIPDEEVLNSNDRFGKLREAMNGRKIEDYKAVVADKLKGYKKERDDIPPRIDELSRTLPSEEVDYTEVENQIAEYQTTIAGIDSEMNSTNGILENFKAQQQKVFLLKGRLDEVKRQIDAEAGSERNGVISEKNKIENQITQLNANLESLNILLRTSETSLQECTSKKATLLEDYKQISAELKEAMALEFVEPDENNFICTTCKRELSEESKEEKLSEMRLNFENAKQLNIKEIESDLARNKKNGLAMKDKITEINGSISGIKSKIEETETLLQSKKAELNEVDNALLKPVEAPVYSQFKKYSDLEKQIKEQESSLAAPEIDNSELIKHKNEIQAKINLCNRTLAAKQTNIDTKTRIEELRADEKRVSTLITELEGHKYLMDQFEVAKVNLLEGSINSHFKYVTWKMFSLQVNGGVDNNVCEAMVNGVPFADANNAAKINAGMDIINALSTYYGVNAPVFIDNRESVVKLLESQCQVISLIVKEKDKQLRVEVAE